MEKRYANSEVSASIIEGESVPPVCYDHDYIVQPSSPNSKLQASQNEIEALQCILNSKWT